MIDIIQMYSTVVIRVRNTFTINFTYQKYTPNNFLYRNSK